MSSLSPKQLRAAAKMFPDLLTADQKAELDRLNAKRARKMQQTESGIIYPDGLDLSNISDEFNADFDIKALMSEAEDPVTGIARDLKIDDRDMKQAKNYYDFAFNIIGRDSSPPWSRQLWTGAALFGDICPCCSNKKWLDIHNVPKDYPAVDLPAELVFLEHGVCPKCKRHKWELIQNHGMRDYLQLDNVLGQRSGKSSSAAYMAAYMTHRWLKFPLLGQLAPHAMQASTELTGTFVSLNFAKAVSVLWTPYMKLIDDSTWFKDYFALLDFYKSKYGKELYRKSTLYMRFFHKNMRFYPSGPRSSTLRGDTRLFALLDELGLFPVPDGDSDEDDTSERANADEAHKSLVNSLTTVSGIRQTLLKTGQSSVPPCAMLCVSSPISQRDKVMRLLKESRTEEGSKFILGINLPTWEVNPTLDRNSPVIASAYNSNPVKAERDFGANPPADQNQYIPNDTVAEGIFVGGRNSHNYTVMYEGTDELYGKVQQVRTYPWPGLVTIDAGVVNNSFTITGGHYNFETGKAVVTTVVEVMPQDKRRINFNLVYKHLILPLCKDLHAVAMLADQWQSIELLSRIKEDMGLNPKGKPTMLAKQHSPSRRRFDTTVSMLENKNLICPSVDEKLKADILEGRIDNYRTQMVGYPVEHLMLQMVTVQDLGITRTPGKGQGYTDDIFRSFVLFASMIHEPAVMDRLKEAKDWMAAAGVGGGNAAPPMYFSRSGMRPMGNGRRGGVVDAGTNK